MRELELIPKAPGELDVEENLAPPAPIWPTNRFTASGSADQTDEQAHGDWEKGGDHDPVTFGAIS